jgi:ankyrin repeat protein
MHRLMLLTTMFALGCAHAPRSPFARAIADDDADAVRRFLQNGEAVDQREERGLTPLMWAARADSVRTIAVLVDAGADLNTRDTYNRWTPLMHAVHKHSTAAAELLLERGANPNAVEYPGQLVPLLMAAGDPDPTIVRLLLQHGANPRYTGELGVTPLALAMSGGALTDLADRPLLGGCHPATVRAILEADPEIRLEDSAASKRAYFFAKFHSCVDSVRLIGDEHR